MSAPRRAAGTTLVEVLIVISILAVVTSVATLAVRRIEKPTPGDPAATIADSLTAVVARGRDATIAVSIDGRLAFATVHADGRVTSDSAFGADPLTGRSSRAR